MEGENQLTRELTKEELAEFRSAFDMFDIDGGGTFYNVTCVSFARCEIKFT
jgi:Ca2+-binding EF-hand superfamily protein